MGRLGGGQLGVRLGIDFGTTNSSIALYNGEGLVPIVLDRASDTPLVLASLIYIDRDHRALLGTAAAQEYLRHETGRPVRWEKRYVRDVEVVVGGAGGPIIYNHPMSVTVDEGAHGRLLQSVKTALRDLEYDGTQIFDRYYTLDEIIAIVLRALKARAEEQLGVSCDGVVIGRPVRFSDDPIVTDRAEETLFKAARLAGFREMRFELEPIGAAYLYGASSQRRETALVFDFGGGTLDLTIVQLGGRSAPEVLATRGVLVGGDDLDRRVMRDLMRFFGTESLLRGGQTFPLEIVNLLRDWQTMPELSRPYYRTMLEALLRSSTEPDAIRSLRTLVSRNLGFQLFQDIERTKKRLSDAPMARLQFAYEDIDIREILTRVRFEELIAQEIERARAGVHRVLRAAGLGPDQVDVALRTGGTSMVPAFIRVLAQIFGAEKLTAMDPLGSVVGGLAVAAHEGAGRRPAYMDRYAAEGNPIVTRVLARSGRPVEVSELHVGSHCYVDNHSFSITRMPLALVGLPAIRMAALDREASWRTFLRFYIRRPARVYVAYEVGSGRLPEWLRAFEPQDMRVQVVQDAVRIEFQVYARDFAPGKVVLGGNQGPGYRGGPNANYMVIVSSYTGEREEQVV